MKNNHLKQLLLPCMLFILLVPSVVLACSCELNFARAADEADAIFIGTLNHIGWGVPWRSENEAANRTYGLRFKVAETILGDVGSWPVVDFRRMKIKCSQNMSLGKTYLVFARLDTETNRLQVLECGGTQTVETAGEMMEYLEANKDSLGSGIALSSRWALMARLSRIADYALPQIVSWSVFIISMPFLFLVRLLNMRFFITIGLLGVSWLLLRYLRSRSR
jgi:hypothetical protein